jgi:uncharacterized protein (TIGR00369 family)
VSCADVIDLQYLSAANGWSNFNWRAGFEVFAAGGGEAEIRMKWNDRFTQYAGHLHAGMTAALLETACGFAAATVAGSLAASHFSMNCLKPVVGRVREGNHGARGAEAGLCPGGTFRGKRAGRGIAGGNR